MDDSELDEWTKVVLHTKGEGTINEENEHGIHQRKEYQYASTEQRGRDNEQENWQSE